jgi:hypothetical protein
MDLEYADFHKTLESDRFSPKGSWLLMNLFRASWFSWSSWYVGSHLSGGAFFRWSAGQLPSCCFVGRVWDLSWAVDGSDLIDASSRLSFSMKYCSHVTVADSCCKSADRGRSHQLDTFAARISVSKAFQKRNRYVCESSLEACQIIHSLDACLVNPFQHSPSENQAFFSKVSQFI